MPGRKNNTREEFDHGNEFEKLPVGFFSELNSKFLQA